MSGDSDATPVEGGAVATDVARLVAQHGDHGYREFLTAPALSLGLFVAPPGDVDAQDPHDRDEVYVILAGGGVLDIAGTPHAVSAGSVAYVPAGVPHRFAEVHTELHVLVMFAGDVR